MTTFTLGIYCPIFANDGDKDLYNNPRYEGIVIEFSYSIDATTAYFENTTENPNILLEWDMGDGTVVFEKNEFEHNFSELGHFLVCLYFKDAETNQYLTKKCQYIEIGADDLCDLTWEPVCGCDNRTYMNPCYAENYHGVYLWSYGKCPDNPDPVLVPEYTYNINERTVELFNSSVGTYDKFTWDFGDGTFSEKRNPIHTYMQDGDYEICLTIKNSHTKEKERVCEKVLLNVTEGVGE